SMARSEKIIKPLQADLSTRCRVQPVHTGTKGQCSDIHLPRNPARPGRQPIEPACVVLTCYSGPVFRCNFDPVSFAGVLTVHGKPSVLALVPFESRQVGAGPHSI